MRCILLQVLFGVLFVHSSLGAISGKPTSAPSITSISTAALNISTATVLEATSYRFIVTQRHGSADVPTLCSNDTSLEITNLLPNTIYDFTVAGVNADGQGDQSDLATARTLPNPVTFSLSDPLPESVFLLFDNTPGVTKITAEYRPQGSASSTAVTTEDENPYVIRLENLVPNTDYEVRARATEVYGSAVSGTQFSEWSSFRTDSLSLFLRIELSSSYDAATLQDTTGTEYTELQNTLRDTFSGVAGFLNGNIIAIENDAGTAVAHYEIQVRDAALPAAGDFAVTSSDISALYINNEDTSGLLGPVLIIEDNLYAFANRATGCASQKPSVIMTSNTDSSKKYDIDAGSDTHGCGSLFLRFENGGFEESAGSRTNLTRNRVYSVDIEFLESIPFASQSGKVLYNRRYRADDTINNVVIRSFIRTIGITAEDIDSSSFTYKLTEGNVILSVPKLQRAVRYTIKDDSGGTLASLENNDIDNSDRLQITIPGLSADSSHTLTIEVTTTGHDGQNSTALTNFVLSTDSGLCSACSSNADCDLNINGIATCVCRLGYTGNGQTCSNVDHCESASCHDFASCFVTPNICENNPGYQCVCNSGFTGNGTSCGDIVNCGVDDNCQENADCVDTIGSFVCVCKPGFTGDGFSCNDIVNCGVDDNCHENATCTDTLGGYACICNSGFMGNGTHCTPAVDPTTESPTTLTPPSCNYSLYEATNVRVTCSPSTNVAVTIRKKDTEPTFSTMACQNSSAGQEINLVIAEDGTAEQSGLIPGNWYHITTIRNDGSMQSTIINETFLTGTVTPPTPQFVTSASSMTINWAKDHEGIAFNVKLKSIESDHDFNANVSTTDQRWLVSGLQPGGQYEACVVVLYCKVESDDEKCVSTYTLPNKVGEIAISKTSTSVKASWDAVRGATRYTAKLESRATRKRRRAADLIQKTTNETNVAFDGLVPATKYRISIAAENPGGSAAPAIRDFTTKENEGTDYTVWPYWWAILLAVLGLFLIILFIVYLVRRVRQHWKAKLKMQNADQSQTYDVPTKNEGDYELNEVEESHSTELANGVDAEHIYEMIPNNKRCCPSTVKFRSDRRNGSNHTNYVEREYDLAEDHSASRCCP